MTEKKGTVIVARPVGDVFAFVSDPRNIPKWDPTIASVEVTEVPVRMGTRGSMTGGVTFQRAGAGAMPVPFEVTELERPHRFAIRSEAQGGLTTAAATLRWMVEPVAGLPDVTRVTVVTEMESKGLLGFMAPLFGALTRDDMSQGLQRLRDVLESA